MIRDRLGKAGERVYAIARCVDGDSFEHLRSLARRGVDVRLVISDSCRLRRAGLDRRLLAFLVIPVIVIMALLIPYSPYLAALVGFLGVVIAFAAISRHAASALSGGWVRIVPSNSGFLDRELFIIDDEAFIVTDASTISDVPLDDALRYFNDIWSTL